MTMKDRRPASASADSAAAQDYRIRPVTLNDAEDYVRCRAECLAETYADLMPPEFAALHRHDLAGQATQTRRTWRQNATEPEPRTAAWLARDHTGEVVGIARSGPGMQAWETTLDAPPSPAPFQLHHLYTRRRTYGTGLGRQLLELAVGDRDTYLWIVAGNARADRFYRRVGFAPDGGTVTCGPTWFFREMYRLVRSGPGPG